MDCKLFPTEQMGKVKNALRLVVRSLINWLMAMLI